MRSTRTTIVVLATLWCAASANAAESSIPPPPEPPPWIEPVPLTAQLQVVAHSCDDYKHEPTEESGLRPQWRDDGRLHLTGAVLHNGSARIESDGISAWQVGDRIVVAYQTRVADSFPETPTMACPGHTHVEITFPALSPRPKEITVYAGRLEYSGPISMKVAPD